MSRPIWQGSITFGLVNIPVSLQTAVQEKTVNFHMLSKDGTCRLRRKLYCPDTGKEVDYADTARGIEVAKDEYVLVDDKELEKLRPEKGKSLTIEQFVNLDEVDPIYFDRPYFVAPSGGSDRAYKLLYEAMKDSGKVGIARFTMRGHQYLATLRILGDGLALHTMHYADEVQSLDDILPASLARTKPAAKEVQIAAQLIDAMTHPLDLSKYKDDYREQVQTLVERKRKGKKIVEPSDDHAEPIPPTYNLMEALKQSLQSRKPARAASARAHRKSA
jgi:DNA end-binding protein Ku